MAAVPTVKPHLTGKALCFTWNINPAYKTAEYFEAVVEHLISQVYNGNMGGEFIDIMIGIDWLQSTMTADVFTFLAGLPKVPFTDGGLQGLKAIIAKR